MRAASLVLLAVLLAGCQSFGSGEAAGFGGTGKAETPFEATGRAVQVKVVVSPQEGHGHPDDPRSL